MGYIWIKRKKMCFFNEFYRILRHKIKKKNIALKIKVVL